MRLIDADSIQWKGSTSGMNGYPDIRNAPTVDAIPVDWIIKNADIFFYGIERLRLMDMINKWKQENNSI